MPNVQPIKSVNVAGTVHPLDSVFTVLSGISTIAGSSSSSSYKSVRWYVSDISGITEPYDGMKLAIKIPLAGVATAGAVLSINGDVDANYHPLAYNINTALTTHFPVNSIKIFTYDANQTMDCYLASKTKVAVTGVWKAESNYDSNTTITYGTLAYYLRPYAAQTIYRYKFVMLDKDNRLVPLTTTNVADGTAVTNQTPTDKAFRPEKIYWYSATGTISAGAAVAGNTLVSIGYNANNSTNGGMAVCNFNSTIAAYRMIYLCGNYNKSTGLFTLRDGGTASSTNYYVQVPTNTANLDLSTYFNSSYDYILLGGTYSSNTYIHLMDNNPMYYFDGTNLIPYSATDTGATSIETTGTGNVVSGASYDTSTRKITLTKGITALTSHQAIKTLKTDNTTAQTASSGEALNGSGTINLHKIAKTGNYNDLLNRPTIPTDTNQKVKAKNSGTDVTFGDNAVVEIKAGTNVQVAANATDNTITISSTDTNTTYTVASGDSNGQIKVTPSSGDAYNVNVKGLGSAAYKTTGTASGNVPVLDSNGKLAESVIPAVAITDTYEAASQTAMLALTAQKGDICIRSDLNKSFVLQTTPASTLANWKELKTPTDAVLSVNGKTGAVQLAAADVGAATSTHKHSYTPAGSVSLGSNDTASGGVAYVASVSGTSVSGTPTTRYLHKATTNVSPNAHTHTVTVSGTTGANSGTKVTAVTGVGANGTTDVNYNAIKGVSLSASTTSTDGPVYVSGVSGGSAVSPTTKYMKFNAGTTPPSSATFSGTKTNSLVTAVSVNSQGSVTLSGSRSTSGSGTSARRTLTITGSHSGTTLTVTKGDYTPAGTVSFTAGTAPSMNFNTGTNTDTPYISAVSGGSEVTVTTRYMKIETTDADTKTVLTGVKATSTADAAPAGHTHSYGSSTALTTSANSGSAVAAITSLTANEEQTTGDIKYLENYVVSGGTVSGTTKYFHPSFSGTAKDTGEPK